MLRSDRSAVPGTWSRCLSSWNHIYGWVSGPFEWQRNVHTKNANSHVVAKEYGPTNASTLYTISNGRQDRNSVVILNMLDPTILSNLWAKEAYSGNQDPSGGTGHRINYLEVENKTPVSLTLCHGNNTIYYLLSWRSVIRAIKFLWRKRRLIGLVGRWVEIRRLILKRAVND